MAGSCQGLSAARLGIAFACVIGAGLASLLGGLVILFVPVKNKLFLAGSLAFAAGVMLYISLVDIYIGKGVGHFVDAGYSDAQAFCYATTCFFGGFPICWVLHTIAERMAYQGHDKPMVPPPPPAVAIKAQGNRSSSQMVPGTPSARRDADVEIGSDSGSNCNGQDSSDQDSEDPGHSRKLAHLSILAAMAVALHNMPEGLVTFVGYMDSVTSGITTAVAIAIHNIPEGMVVASAVYFGTGNRARAVLWAALAALTEPLGGLIGLAVVCGGSMTDTVFGILFGLVGGIMTYISLKELLPGARNFDPEDRVTTTSVTAGMIIMACSLIAIAYSAAPEAAAETVVAAVTSPPQMA